MKKSNLKKVALVLGFFAAFGVAAYGATKNTHDATTVSDLSQQMHLSKDALAKDALAKDALAKDALAKDALAKDALGVGSI